MIYGRRMWPRKLEELVASGSWLTAKRARLYPLAFLTVNSLLFLTYVLLGHGNLDPFGKPIGTDFASFWTASAFVLSGNAASAYNPMDHYATQSAMFGKSIGYHAWLYPPTALLIVAPLSFFPYLPSLFSWLAVTGAAYVATVRKFIPQSAAIVPILGFPAVYANFGHGQNAFLSTAIVGAGLLMSDRQPFSAGIILGCLSYKPQLAPILLIVVLARRNWKMALGAAISIAVQVAVTTLLFGPDIWRKFWLILPMTQVVLEQGLVGFDKMQSVFAAVRLVGGGVAVAYALQVSVAIAAASLTWLIWRSEATLLLRAGATAAAMLLSTPFLLDYDFVLLSLPIAALAFDGLKTGFRPYERTTLAAAWLLPAVARVCAQYLGIPLSPEITFLLLVLLWKRATFKSKNL